MNDDFTEEIKRIIEEDKVEANLRLSKLKNSNYVAFNIQKNLLENQTSALEMYNELEKNPKDALETIKILINQRYKENDDPEIGVILNDIPKTENYHTRISHIRAEHESKGVIITGMVKRKSQNHTYISEVKRECTACGNIITLRYNENQTPVSQIRCSCGGKKSRVINEKSTNIQYYDVEEIEPDQNGRRESITCVLKKDLTRPEIINEIELGKEVVIFGKIEKKLMGNKENLFNKNIAVYGIEATEHQDTYDITPEEINDLKELSQKGDLINWWIKKKKLYDPIEGYNTIKEAIICTLIGSQNTIKNGKLNRGISHLYICGDASSAKSTFLKLTQEYALKSKYLTGMGATGVGLTGTISKDENIGWVAEAGALPLMNKGIVLADELDKLPEGEEDKLHEAMEQLSVSLNKADISITLPCQTTLISAGNPKTGRIDPYQDTFTQLGLKQTTASRFDLIFITRDIPNPENDKLIADKMVNNWDDEIDQKTNKESITLFKKYQKYAKKIRVTIDEETKKEITDWYVEIRKKIQNAQTKMIISSRALDAIMRLTKSHSRANLRNQTTKADVEWAKKVYFESLKTIATDIITGEIDMQKLETGFGRSEMKTEEIILSILDKSQEPVDYEDLKRQLNKDLTDRQIEAILDKLKRSGEVYSPRMGKYKTLR